MTDVYISESTEAVFGVAVSGHFLKWYMRYSAYSESFLSEEE